jgi:hypothetical protein
LQQLWRNPHLQPQPKRPKGSPLRRNGGTPFPSAPVGDRVTAIPDKETDVLVPGPTTTSIWCPAGVLVTTSWSGTCAGLFSSEQSHPQLLLLYALDNEPRCPATFKTGCENPRLTRGQTLQPCRTSFSSVDPLLNLQDPPWSPLARCQLSQTRLVSSSHCCFDTRATFGPGCLPCQLLRSSFSSWLSFL